MVKLSTVSIHVSVSGYNKKPWFFGAHELHWRNCAWNVWRGSSEAPASTQFISGAFVHVHIALLQFLRGSFSHRSGHQSDISKCLLWLWPQLRGMSLAALCPVTDFIPCVTTYTLLGGTKTLLWGVSLAFWTGDWCAKCTIHSHLATAVRSGNRSLENVMDIISPPIIVYNKSSTFQGTTFSLRTVTAFCCFNFVH